MPEPLDKADLYHKLGVLEGKLDTVIASNQDAKREVEILNKRVSSVEANVNKFVGVAIVLSVVLPILITTIAAPHSGFSNASTEEIR